MHPKPTPSSSTWLAANPPPAMLWAADRSRLTTRQRGSDSKSIEIASRIKAWQRQLLHLLPHFRPWQRLFIWRPEPSSSDRQLRPLQDQSNDDSRSDGPSSSSSSTTTTTPIV
ncbi:hypothetical protein ACLOJK_041536 [Asimina triloba]